MQPTSGGSCLRLLAVLMLFCCGTTLVWLRLDRAPPAWDDGWYLTNSLVMYDALGDGGLVGYIKRFFSILGFKAPLITVLPTPFYLVAGRRWHYAFLVNIGSTVWLLGAIWRIGARLWNERVGLMAACIAGTMPLLYGLARWYLVEYPLAATVAIAIWLLAESRDLESGPAALLFGITCGLGLLLKVSFPLFVLAPFLYVLWRCKRRGRALWWIAVPCLVLALPWYWLHWRATIDNAFAAGFGESAIVQGSAIGVYLKRIAREGISLYYGAAALVAATIVPARRGMRALRPPTLVVLWALPFVVFAFGGNKDIRYIAPILPAFALLLAYLLDSAVGGRPRVLALLLIFPLASMAAVSFGWPYRAAGSGYARRYDRQSWPQQEILRLIREHMTIRPGERQLLLVGTDRAAFNVNNFELAVVEARLPLAVDTTAYEKDLAMLLRTVDAAAFFLYKEGGEPESTFFNRHFAEVIRHVRESADKQEIPYGRMLPDGGVVHIFGKK